MFDSLNGEILFQFECFLRIILSGICGIAIGYERKKRKKGAGIRTHLVVALASSLMMIVSKYGFSDIGNIVNSGADVRVDPSRIASQIVTGVGFLGAGMIYFNHGSIIGLTTAAGIWATSGVGMAIGSGMYFIGIAASMSIIVAQTILHIKMSNDGTINEENIVFVIENSDDAIISIRNIIKKYHINIDSMQYTPIENNLIEVSMCMSGINTVTADRLLDYVKSNLYIKSAKLNTEIKV